MMIFCPECGAATDTEEPVYGPLRWAVTCGYCGTTYTATVTTRVFAALWGEGRVEYST